MRRIAPLTLVIAAVLLTAAPASAQETVIGFDDLSPGTVVKDQYQDQGLRLARSFFGDMDETAVVRTAAPAAGNRLQLPGSCGGEFCSGFLLSGRLDFQRQHIEVTVLENKNDNRPGGFQGPPTLRAYDAQNNVIDTQTMPADTPVPYTLELTSPSQNIQFFEIGGVRFIDDLTFDNPANPPPPDFAVVPLFPFLQGPDQVRIKAGNELTVDVLLNRYNLSSGPIRIDSSVEGSDVTATTGITTTGPDGTLVPIEIQVPANAEPQEVQLEITGEAQSIAAGPTGVERTITFEVSVFRDYDLRTTGIEVTQGIQRELVRCMVPVDCDENFSLPFRNPGAPNAPVPYHGFFPFPYTSSTMVAGKRTVARVFANVREPTSPPNARVDQVGMQLRGFGPNGELPGSPLLPDRGLRTLRSGGPGDTAGGAGQSWVTFKDRADPAGAFNFTLPDEWTRRGTISLRAELVPPDDLGFGGQQASRECTTAGCAANNRFTLSGIPFHRVGSTRVAMAWLYVDGDSPYGPVDENDNPVILRELMSYSHLVLPFAEGDLRVGNDFYASINAQEAVDDNPNEAGDDDDGDVFRARTSQARDMLEDYASDYPGCSYLDFCAEVIGGVQVPELGTGGVSDGDYPGVSTSAVGRTPTIAHEISHNLGREHSGEDCPGIGENGQTAEAWPPDEMGLMHGIGLDTRPGSGGPAGYRVIAPSSLGAPDSVGAPLLDFPIEVPQLTIEAQANWFDQQSYCRLGDRDRWTSTIGLERFFTPTTFLPPQGLVDAVPPSKDFDLFSKRSVRAQSAARRLLHVQAIAGTGVTPRITVVKQRTIRPRALPETSEYHLVARDASGAVVADVPMAARIYEPDPEVMLTGQAEAENVASVEVTFNGTVIATRTRSAAVPEVSIQSPRRGQRVGRGRGVPVRWTATDADGDDLQAKVDYSFDGGRNWTVLFVGPNTGTTTIPSDYLSRSRRARLRVRVNDGFNEGQANSAIFTAVGRRPSIELWTPVEGQRIAADGLLSMFAQANDDRRRRLRGRSLRWSVAGRPIATGERASAIGVLSPGRPRVRVVARDSRGRRSSATVRIRVLAVPPQFLRLVAPDRVASSARTVVLRVATNVRAQLRARGTRASVGRRTQRVRVRVRPGSGTLRIPVRLRAGRFTARRVVTIAR